MDFNVYLDSDDRRVKSYIDKIIEKINAHQNDFRLIDKSDTVENQRVCEKIFEMLSSNMINFLLLKQNLDEVLSSEEHHIIITDKAFDDNYFTHSRQNFKMISVSDWEELYAPPHMDKYILRQILKSYIQHSIDYVISAHRDSKGCLFDFCIHKTDIKISMRTGYLCPQCEQ